MTLSFGPVSGLLVGEISPNQVLTGDWNGDGNLDLVATQVAFYGSNASVISVRLGDGAGNFSPPSAQVLSSQTGIKSLGAGDFNKDGKLDLLVLQVNSAPSYSNTATVALGDGTGKFTLLNNGLSIGTAFSNPTIGDFNGDSNLDVAISNSNTVSILLGNGTGGFTSGSSVPVRGYSQSLTSGDFNKDSKLDLAIVSYDSNNGEYGTQVAILLGDGSGSFNTSTSVFIPYTQGVGYSSILAADFNKDGNLDVALPGGALLGDGTGNLKLSSRFSNVFSSSANLSSADFNGDGNLDVLQAGSLSVFAPNSEGVFISLGDGLGGFSGPAVTKISGVSTSSAVGDFNKDGKPDVIAANSVSQNLSLLLNTTTGTDALVLSEPLIDASSQLSGSLNVNLGRGTLSLSGTSPIQRIVSNYTDVTATIQNDSIVGNRQANILRGIAGNDTLNGADGDDRLVGSEGNDLLTGGKGKDRFVFRLEERGINQPFSRALGIDRITDFKRGQDKIVLNQDTFLALTKKISFASVKNLAEARSSRALITYISSTGRLYYNENGRDRGFGAGGAFADLENGLKLRGKDFSIFLN